jgi:phage-related protein
MALNPIGIVVLAIIGLVAAFIYLWKTNDGFRNALIKTWNAIKGAVSGAVSFVVNFVRKNWPLLLGILTGPIGLAVVLIVRHWGTIRKATSAAFSAVRSAISTAINFVVSFITNRVNNIRNTWVNAWNAMRNFVGTAWNNIRSAIARGLNAVVSLAGGLVSRILRSWGNMGSLLYGSGRDIIQGLINGINGMAGRVLGIAGDLANRVKDKIASVLKIGSPSRVMVQFGRWTGEGLAIGMKDRFNLIEKTSQGMAGAVTAGYGSPHLRNTASVLSSVGTGAGAGNTYQINVTAPVGSSPALIGKAIVDNIKAHEAVAGNRWRN